MHMVCMTHDDGLQDLGKQGLKNLVVVPLSFVSEHVETLEEIDIEYREVANEVLARARAFSCCLCMHTLNIRHTHVSQLSTRALTFKIFVLRRVLPTSSGALHLTPTPFSLTAWLT